MNGASDNLTAEKRELVEIEKKINNGVRAILSGMDIPELKNEVDRLRVRKTELEYIIKYKSRSDPDAVIELLNHCTPAELKLAEKVLKLFLMKV